MRGTCASARRWIGELSRSGCCLAIAPLSIVCCREVEAGGVLRGADAVQHEAAEHVLVDQATGVARDTLDDLVWNWFHNASF
jgi:hypothetical protein